MNSNDSEPAGESTRPLVPPAQVNRMADDLRIKQPGLAGHLEAGADQASFLHCISGLGLFLLAFMLVVLLMARSMRYTCLDDYCGDISSASTEGDADTLRFASEGLAHLTQRPVEPPNMEVSTLKPNERLATGVFVPSRSR